MTEPIIGPAAADFAQRRLRPYLDDVFEVPAGADADERRAATRLGDDLLAEVDRAAAALRGRFRCIAVYAALAPADREWFDKAAGLMAAITLLAPAMGQANDGLAKLREGDQEKTFAPPDAGEERRWTAELTEIVGNIACIRAARTQIAANVNLFGATGRTRTRQENGRHSLPAMIASLLPAGWGGDRRSLLTTGVADAGGGAGAFY